LLAIFTGLIQNKVAEGKYNTAEKTTSRVIFPTRHNKRAVCEPHVAHYISLAAYKAFQKDSEYGSNNITLKNKNILLDMIVLCALSRRRVRAYDRLRRWQREYCVASTDEFGRRVATFS
jgi:hypothetical protein